MLVTFDSMNGRNMNSILQFRNILQYVVDMNRIKVHHVTLNNKKIKMDNHSYEVVACLYSCYASLMIKKKLSKEEWCKTKIMILINSEI